MNLEKEWIDRGRKDANENFPKLSYGDLQKLFDAIDEYSQKIIIDLLDEDTLSEFEEGFIDFNDLVSPLTQSEKKNFEFWLKGYIERCKELYSQIQDTI